MTPLAVVRAPYDADAAHSQRTPFRGEAAQEHARTVAMRVSERAKLALQAFKGAARV